MNGYYYVTGYYLPAIYKFNSDFSGEPEIFFEGNYIVYPTYNVEHNSLLITYYNQNNWEEIPLTPSSIISDEFHVSTVLHKSYPNPFTSSTTIKFDLNKYATIRLEVCDSAGRIINTLINENKSAGNYSASWDGKDNSGYQVSNGTYFFRLTVNGATRTQSIVLLNY